MLFPPAALERAMIIREVVQRAVIGAIERYLGISAGTLHRVDARTVNSWIVALRRADTALAGARNEG